MVWKRLIGLVATAGLAFPAVAAAQDDVQRHGRGSSSPTVLPQRGSSDGLVRRDSFRGRTDGRNGQVVPTSPRQKSFVPGTGRRLPTSRFMRELSAALRSSRAAVEFLGVPTHRYDVNLAKNLPYGAPGDLYVILPGQREIIVKRSAGAEGVRRAFWELYQNHEFGFATNLDLRRVETSRAAPYLQALGDALVQSHGRLTNEVFRATENLAAVVGETSKIYGKDVPSHLRRLSARLWQLSLQAPKPDRLSNSFGRRPSVSSLRARLRFGDAGLGRYALGYMISEGMNGLERGEPGRLSDAFRSVTSVEGVASVAAFTTLSRVASVPMDLIPMSRFPRFVRAPLRAGVPLALATMGMDVMTGHGIDLARTARQTVAYTVTGTAVHTIMDATLGRALLGRGWLVTGGYEALKTGFTLYTGEKLERGLTQGDWGARPHLWERQAPQEEKK